MERDVVADAAGELTLRASPFARKNTGSYYTPEELVRLILRRAVGPLLDERKKKFTDRIKALARDRRPKAERLRDLRDFDPAQAFLALRICDPAMGSGHFLVSLVDYLTDEVLTAITEAPASVHWADVDQLYRSPLVERVERLRAEILRSAAANRWDIREEQLDDRHLIRRIILKRVIYGVDLNPMAVELSKLSLWLHSFTVGAPMSFLDHHLRCGDSLFGEFVGPVERELHDRYQMVMTSDVLRARRAAAGMAQVEESADADIGEVRSSKELFDGVEANTAELRAFLDLVHAERWLTPTDDLEELGREGLFGGNYGDPVQIAAGKPLSRPRDGTTVQRRGRRYEPAELQETATAFVTRARELAAERRFLHWEPAFPGVWTDWESAEPRGGFDAVIGNPPWDRMKLQEVEWFAVRVPEIAHAQRATDRKRMVRELREAGDPIAADYQYAAWIAETAVRAARDSGAFPLLSSGDVNIYSLFVERAMRLVRRDGIVGLLVPSGIAADLSAAKFFRTISTSGRLASLFDFENRRPTRRLDHFFPDVDSRFKFSALVAGGPGRIFPRADCAFFQQDALAAEANAFPLAPDDFAVVNPNTGTAPVFRSRRDAEITLDIYRRFPVLVDRRGEELVSQWPVRYIRMFDMTNDSDKFRTAEELEAAGAYRVGGQRWHRGEERWLPLHEGKMVQAYDHRAASVIVNLENLNRPGQPAPASLEQHASSAWIPTPQFWVQTAELTEDIRVGAVIGFKDITSPTNARTMIAAFVPAGPFGNTLPVLFPEQLAADQVYRISASLWLANLNCFAFDYVARQKVQGTHVNWYIVEQLPVIPAAAYSRRFGQRTAEEVIRDDVLHLTYTSDDIAAFAREQGYDGAPFRWDEEDRLRRRARVDAIFFQLYGLSRDVADYVLGTFPIVRREEEQQHGRYRSRDLILGYMAALDAGEPDAPVDG